MRKLSARPGQLAAIGLGITAASGLVAALCTAETRANLTWALGSWRRPADRNASWEQQAGRRVDLLERIKRGS